MIYGNSIIPSPARPIGIQRGTLRASYSSPRHNHMLHRWADHMNHSDHFESQEGTDSRFGQVFSAYSKAFRSRDDEGLKAAFHPEAIVRVHDRRKKEVLTLTPHEFFTRLYREIGDAEFRVETLKARFDDGYLFADGVWITEGQKPILRAADLFSALQDGRVSSLTVVWTDATTV